MRERNHEWVPIYDPIPPRTVLTLILSPHPRRIGNETTRPIDHANSKIHLYYLELPRQLTNLVVTAKPQPRTRQYGLDILNCTNTSV